MATKILKGSDTAIPRDYGQSMSWTDRLIGLPERLPGPAEFWHVFLAAALLAVGHLAVWLAGATPLGAPEPEIIPPIVFVSCIAWLLLVVKRVARSAFEEFRPALGVDELTGARYRFQLISIPDRLAALAIAVVVPFVATAYYGTVRPLRPPISAAIELVSGPLWVLAAAAFGVMFFQSGTQLRMVSRLSALASNVDIFKPGPINSFARLTSVSAIAILVFVAFIVLVIPEQPAAYIAGELIVIALGVAAFVLPLRVMHGRLQREKMRLLGEAQDRLKLTLSRVHAAVESNDLASADQLNKTLLTVLAERDVLTKLPTWPWSTATFRGVATAVLLPVLIFVITRAIDRFM